MVDSPHRTGVKFDSKKYKDVFMFTQYHYFSHSKQQGSSTLYILSSFDIEPAVIFTRTITKKVLLAIISACILVLSHFATASETETQQIIQELDQLDQIDRKIELFTRLNAGQERTNYKAHSGIYLDWLREKSLNDGITSRYSTLYGFFLMRSGYEESAQIMITRAMLQLHVDVARCKNMKNSYRKYMRWYGIMLNSRILNNMPTKTEHVNKRILRAAIKQENKNKNRKGDDWLCSGVNWARVFSQPESINKAAISNTGHLGKTISVIATPDMMNPAEFISDKEWKRTRKKRIKEFKQHFQKNHMRLAKEETDEEY